MGDHRERRVERVVRTFLLALGLIAVASSTLWVARNAYVTMSRDTARTRLLLANAREEKDTALELVGARDKEVSQLKQKLQQAIDTPDAKDRVIEKRNQQVQDNKQAAKALGEVIERERKQREDLKRNIDGAIRPHVDNCNKALKEKNEAIAALVLERDSHDRLNTNIDREIEDRERTITRLKNKLEGKEGEIMRLRMEHQEAAKDHSDKASHAANIWKATVEDASSACPSPLPPLSEAFQLGDFLQEERRRVGAELGFQAANFTEGLMERWFAMTSFYVVEPSGGQIAAVRNVTRANARIRLVIHEDPVAAISEFSESSLDFVHVSPASLGPQEGAPGGTLERTLEGLWPKVRPGGLISGGFPSPGTTVGATTGLGQDEIRAIKFAVAGFSKHKRRQASFALESNSVAWIIRR